MKMRVKITAAMIMVALVAASIFGLISFFMTRNIFNNYMEQQRFELQTEWALTLADYYREYGSWEGLSIVPQPMPGMMRQYGWGKMRQHGAGRFSNQDRLIVLDANMNVVYDSAPGDNDYQQFLNKGEKILVDGESAGYVILIPRTYYQLRPIEQDFYRSIKWMVVLGGLCAIVLAAGSGIVYSNYVTAPLLKLTRAVQNMSSKARAQQVEVVGQDEISDLAKSYNEMVESLERQELLRKNLTADLAHELRTPLAILRGNLEIMQDAQKEISSEKIASLQDEVLRITRLVTDLQELALVEAGKLKMNLQPENLQQLVQQVASTIGFECEARGVKLTVETVPAGGPIEAEVDRDRLTQVIINLLTNALKHTPPGGAIGLKLLPSEAGWQFMVQDTGSGIAPEHLPYVFDRFYRADKARNRSDGGVGLGLAIAKGFVEAHGGRIWVESTPGKGTVFNFIIPKKISPPGKAKAPC